MESVPLIEDPEELRERLLRLYDSEPALASEILRDVISTKRNDAIQLFEVPHLNQLFAETVALYPKLITIVESPDFLREYLETMLDASMEVFRLGVENLFEFFAPDEVSIDESFLVLFERLLSMAVIDSSHYTIERKEAALLALVFLMRDHSFLAMVVPTMEPLEEQIFVDYQRQIELNNAFFSLCLFHFIVAVSGQLPYWRQRLVSITIRSHFFGLLAYILHNSRKRLSVNLAVEAFRGIYDNFHFKKSDGYTVGFDAFCSGLLAVNLNNFRAIEEFKKQKRESQDTLRERVQHNREENVLLEQKIKEILSRPGTKVEQREEIQRLQEITKENEALQKELDSQRLNNRRIKRGMAPLEEEIIELKRQLVPYETNSVVSVSQSSTSSRETQTEIEKSFKQTEVRKQQLLASLKDTTSEATRAKNARDAAKIKNEELQRKIQEEGDRITAFENKLATLQQQNAGLVAKKGSIERKLEELLHGEEVSLDSSDEDILESLEREHAKATADLLRAREKARKKQSLFFDLEERLKVLAEANTRLKQLVQLVHRTTVPLGSLPKEFIDRITSTSAEHNSHPS